MAVLPITNPTLIDLANRLDPDGTVAMLAELLTQQNEILEDMTWVEGNLLTGHKTKVRTGLPEPTWRQLYQGVQPTRSTSAPVTDTCGMMEAYSEIDAAEADLNGNTAEFRLSEDSAHFEGMNQSLANALFYASEKTEPQKFTGFSPRFNSLSAENGQNIITGGGSGSDNTSIWLVVWSPQSCFGIIPKGSKAGWQMTDKGKQTVQVFDSSGANTGKMEAYVTHYRWDAGLCVKDWRYVVRIANIDKSALTKDASAGADLVDLMVQAVERVQSISVGRPVFYCSRTVRSFLRRQTTNKTINATLSADNIAGKPALMLDGIPIKRCDVLAGDEATVS